MRKVKLTCNAAYATQVDRGRSHEGFTSNIRDRERHWERARVTEDPVANTGNECILKMGDVGGKVLRGGIHVSQGLKA